MSGEPFTPAYLVFDEEGRLVGAQWTGDEAIEVRRAIAEEVDRRCRSPLSGQVPRRPGPDKALTRIEIPRIPARREPGGGGPKVTWHSFPRRMDWEAHLASANVWGMPPAFGAFGRRMLAQRGKLTREEGEKKPVLQAPSIARWFGDVDLDEGSEVEEY